MLYRKIWHSGVFMDKISLLRERTKTLLEAGKQVRKDIESLIDEQSFVELSRYSFSKSDFYDGEALGEGVVTGFATVNGYPFYIVAQNPEVLSGGVSKANCEKIENCREKAEKASAPVIWLLSSQGVRIGEGVNVLEGIAALALKAVQLKGSVPQFLIVNGEVYGQIATLAGIADFTYFINKKSVLAVNSPLVLAAKSGKNISKFEAGGAEALKNANIASFTVESFGEIRKSISEIYELLSVGVVDSEEMNDPVPELDKKITIKGLLKVFDKGSAIEVGATYSPEVKCFLARMGGIAVAAVIFDEGEGVYLTANAVRKIKDFAEMACCNNLPYITFVNSLGIKPELGANDSLVLRETGEYINILDCFDSAKISVVYGKAIGFGYTLFAAKSMGYDYSYAFANSQIALFDGAQGAEIEFSDEKADKGKLAEKYAEENSDPINAAKGGYIDGIIAPSLVKQYIVASLQTLLK